MLLASLLYSIEYIVLQGTTKTELSGICANSANVNPGDLFVCIKGCHFDGHRYVVDAVTGGASCIVAQWLSGELERAMDQYPNLTVLLVKDTQKALALLASAFYGDPSHEMIIIGITGTKGKTTTACMLNALLKKAGIPSGLIGTLGARYGDMYETFPTTTPDAIALHRILARMKQMGCTHVILEVSSQSLMQRRVYGIPFEIAVFTNLFADHIGQWEHHSLEEYAYWKSTLFAHTKVSVLNKDSDWSSLMSEMSSGEIRWYSLTERETDGTRPIPVSLPGRFNQENALAALTAAQTLGLSNDCIVGLNHLYIPGRTELLKGNGYNIIIDYAHNESSMENLLNMLKEETHKRLICIYGCGGERSVLRRFGMGRTGGCLADLSVLTEDNSRSEPLSQIIDDLIEGVRSVNGSYVVIPDRREAIHSVIGFAQEGDLIAIVGKGHETWQEINGEKRYFSDKEEALSAMKKRDSI